jgi:hypothetical protein
MKVSYRNCSLGRNPATDNESNEASRSLTEKNENREQATGNWIFLIFLWGRFYGVGRLPPFVP